MSDSGDFPVSKQEGADIYLSALSGQVVDYMEQGDTKDEALRKVVDGLVEFDFFEDSTKDEDLTDQEKEFIDHLRSSRDSLVDEQGLSYEEATKILIGAIISSTLSERSE